MGKREIARYEQFLLFPQCFQKACFPGALKGVIVWEIMLLHHRKVQVLHFNTVDQDQTLGSAINRLNKVTLHFDKPYTLSTPTNDIHRYSSFRSCRGTLLENC